MILEPAPAPWDTSGVTDPEFTVEEVAEGPAGNTVRLQGRLTWEGARRLREELTRVIRVPSVTQLDMAGVDGGAAAVLAQAWGDALRGGAAVQFVGMSAPIQSMLDLYTERVARECLQPEPRREGTLSQIGRVAVELVVKLRQTLEFLGECAAALVAVVRRPSSMNWSDVPRLFERHGADGVPIALLIAFLIGLITAFQAAVQLEQFGADSLVADLVSLSLTRELAPLMIAIVVAGRSGAAIAAEIGTMRVSEEIDALRTLGLCPLRFLVFPRVLALMLVVPLLILLGDAVGIGGGLLIACTQLDVSYTGFLNSVKLALGPWDVFGGVLKGVVFGLLIALIACQRGLAVRGGAEGVGRGTTSAVVAILFYLVLWDALFSVLFNLFDI